MEMRYTFTRFLNALWIYILMSIICGAYAYQYIKAQEPCPLCLLQRIGLISVGIGPLLNLKFGIKPIHYGFAIISACFGGFTAIRQICLHICPSFTQWGIPIFGLQLYTWSLIAFSCSILASALLLILYRPQDSSRQPPLSIFENSAIGFLALVTLGNVITTLIECGLGPCLD